MYTNKEGLLMLRYDVRTGVKKIKTKTALAVSGATLGIVGLVAAIAIPLGAHAAGTVIYSNVPNSLPGNLVSEAFEATSTSEFGGQVSFAGTARTNPTVTVIMSSWGCQNGSWNNNDCVTVPNSTFSEPITLNVYNVGSGNSLGSKILTATQTFNIPYRPSANPVCSDGRWSSDNTSANCFNGFATPITFSLTGSLPDTAIVTLAYNTSDYGQTPQRPQACNATAAGCGYDSLNVGLVNTIPTIGSNPASGVYINSTWNGAYCDNGDGGTASLRYDTGSTGADGACPYQPAISVSSSAASVRIQIFKYVDGVQATASNTNSTTFPMVTTFSSPNLGNYTNVPFTLSPSPWGGVGIPYEADFVGSVGGADYTASEVTTGNNVVGVSCAAGNQYALQGYSVGDNLAQAQNATRTLAAPQFMNLQSDHVMIVWNTRCPVHPTNKDQCKDNGWKTLADDINRAFKNQGDCVSYVATHGKNQANG